MLLFIFKYFYAISDIINKERRIKINKILIYYFSATGTTKNAAEQIFLATNGELFEIESVEKIY